MKEDNKKYYEIIRIIYGNFNTNKDDDIEKINEM